MADHQRQALERILRGGSLADKLTEVPTVAMSLAPVVAPSWLDAASFVPVRDGALRFSQERARFPKLAAGATAAERGKALHFFANHELLAIELLAYGALRYPDEPAGLHASLIRTLAEEQTHLKMYLARMTELGVAFGDFPLNGHFWQLLAPARDGLAFTCGMNLTFEQANLDFAHYYEQRFAAIGDAATAKLMAVIAEDEISHVSRGVYLVKKAEGNSLTQQEAQPEKARAPRSLWQAYRGHLPAAISPMRAKGTSFQRGLRRRAHLDELYIDELFGYRESASQRSRLFYYNPDCERELNQAHASSWTRSPELAARIRDLEYLMTILAKPGDGVLVSRLPALKLRQRLQRLGLTAAEPVLMPDVGASDSPASKFLVRNSQPGEFHPWGQTEGMAQLAAKLNGALSPKGQLSPLSPAIDPAWYSKLSLPAIRRQLALPHQVVGAVVTTASELAERLSSVPKSVIKAPFGAAGSALFAIDSLDAAHVQTKDKTSANFARKWLGAGKALLWEPRFDVIDNFSAVGFVTADRTPQLEGITRFLTTAAGQYAGHEFLPEDAIKEQYAPELARAFTAAGEFLAAGGYVGPFGIDAFTYRADGEPQLQPLSEINSRYTMGHIAYALSRKLSPHVPARWAFIDRKAFAQAGYDSLHAFAAFSAKAEGHPMVQRSGRWQEGIAILTDGDTRAGGEGAFGLSVLSVGEKAIKLTPFPCSPTHHRKDTP